jgi:Cu/Ag efflux pump CusA
MKGFFKFFAERLARYGLTVADIAQNVRIAYDGQVVTSARYGELEVGFRGLIEQKYRQQLEYLRQLRVPNRQGKLVALDEVASLDIGPGTAVFHHYEGERRPIILTSLTLVLIPCLYLIGNGVRRLFKRPPGRV